MLAGHLYLPDNNSDILTNKSGVYTIYEHHQNLNDVNQRQNPINNIYEDLDLRIKKYTDSYYPESVKICEEKVYNNITAFKKENHKLYNYLKSSKNLKKFKIEVGLKPEISVELCVVLYRKNPGNFKSKYPKEYTWMRRNKKLGEFNKRIH